MELMVFQTNASGICQQDHWYIWHIYLITAFRCPIFQRLGGKQKLYRYRNPARTQNLRPISLLSTTGKLFEKVILKTVQGTLKKEACLMPLTARQLHCMRLTEHVTLNFNNNMSTDAVLLSIEKASNKIWHFGLLYKSSELKFATFFIKLINSYPSEKILSLG
jgi:hypothetical protein